MAIVVRFFVVLFRG